MRKLYKRISLGAFGLLSLCLASCTGSDLVTNFYAFDTLCSINIYGGEGATLDKIEDTLSELSDKTDTFINHEINYAYKINKDENEGVPVTVDQDFISLVKKGLEYQEKTNGYFTLLSGELSNLWKESLESKILPEDAVLEEAVANIEKTTLTIDETNLTVTRNGPAKLDFGAIAKGYGLDEAISIMEENNSSHYLINLGRSSIGFGTQKNGDPFKGNITDGGESVLFTIEGLKNTCIGVSGATEQYAEINGTKYTHIINPKNGDAIANYDIVLVTGNSGTICDIFSTALMVMEQADAIALAKENNLGYLFYKQGNDPIYSLEGLEVSFA